MLPFVPLQISECNIILNFDVSPETMTKRLLHRAQTSGRADDNEETIKKRLDTFSKHSKPVIEHFSNKCKTVSALYSDGGCENILRWGTAWCVQYSAPRLSSCFHSAYSSGFISHFVDQLRRLCKPLGFRRTVIKIWQKLIPPTGTQEMPILTSNWNYGHKVCSLIHAPLFDKLSSAILWILFLKQRDSKSN
jgi:hypothetical protein